MMKHRSGKPFNDRRDHYQEVTDRIVARSGKRQQAPGSQPWENGCSRNAASTPQLAAAITGSTCCCWQ